MDFDCRFSGKITRCEQAIGYIFSNKVLCAEALNAAADRMAVYHDGNAIRKLPKNDTLAVYGDIAAGERICGLWLSTGLQKGLWTAIRNDVLGNENLAARGFSLCLDTCITTNHGTNKVSPKMMVTAVEAVLGAVRRDGGYAALVTVMEHIQLTHAFLDTVTSEVIG